jgi:hypothetical protein
MYDDDDDNDDYGKSSLPKSLSPVSYPSSTWLLNTPLKSKVWNDENLLNNLSFAAPKSH